MCHTEIQDERRSLSYLYCSLKVGATYALYVKISINFER